MHMRREHVLSSDGAAVSFRFRCSPNSALRAVFPYSAFSAAHVKRVRLLAYRQQKRNPLHQVELIFTRPKATVNIRGLRTENNANSVNIGKL